MILQTLTNTNAKFSDLRLRRTILNSKTNEVEYVFSYPQKLSEQEKNEIYSIVRSMSPQDLSITLKFELDKYGEKEVMADLKKLIESKFPSIDSRKGIKITQKTSDFCIKNVLSVDNFTAKIIEKNAILDAFDQYFKSITTTKVLFDLNIYQKNIDFSQLVEQFDRTQELQVSLQMSKPKRYFEVENVRQLIGKEIKGSPKYIVDANSPTSNIVLCGKVSKIKSFPCKKPDLHVCKMDICDGTGTLPVVFFAKSDGYKKFGLISEGDEMLMSGALNVNTYNGQLELKAYNISKCNILDPSKQPTFHKKAKEKYLVVKPQLYHSTEQISLLEQKKEVCDYLKNNDVVVFDFETTGLKVLQDRIVEIGAVKIHNGEITETFTTLINPEMPIPPEVVSITHIDDNMVAGKPIFPAVIGDFFKFCDGCTLVAHNLEFDNGFLQYYSMPCGYLFDNKSYDTIELSRKIFTNPKYRGSRPANYKLITIAKALEIETDILHRALDDAIITAKLLIKLLKIDPMLLE